MLDPKHINRDLKASCFPEGLDTAAARAQAVAELWEPFTFRLMEELLDHEQVALVAKAAGDRAQLYVEDGCGHLRGAFADPLGLADAMLQRGVVRVGVVGAAGTAALELAMLALLGEEPQAVSETWWYRVGERFVDEITAEGLPVLPGLAYTRTDAPPPGAGLRVDERLDAAGFGARVRHTRSAAEAIRLFRTGVRQHGDTEQMQACVDALLSVARHYNMRLNDLDSAVALWLEAAAVAQPGTQMSRVIGTMMHVARQRADADEPVADHDVHGAIQLYRAVHGLHVSDEQDGVVLKTMTDVARRFTPWDEPADRRDVRGALEMWEAIFDLDPPTDEVERVVRTMMEVATAITDLRVPGRELDVPAACPVWRSAFEHARSDDERGRVIRTVMAMFNRLARGDRRPTGDELADAVRVWQTAYACSLVWSGEQTETCARTIMQAANDNSDFDAGPVAVEDLRVAVGLWNGVTAVGTADDRLRAIKTMMKHAGQRIGPYSDRDSVQAALLLWHGAYVGAASDDGRLRVVKTIMDLADRYPAAMAHAARLLPGRPGEYDEGFVTPVLAGLLYYQGQYDALLALRGHQGQETPPAVAALQAEALRKLGRFGLARHACDAVIRRCAQPRDRIRAEALVSALCCRGYCLLELGRADRSKLPLALADLQRAIEVAGETKVPTPPRAHTGLGYVRQLQGDETGAAQELARAGALDEDNRKARQGLATAEGPTGEDDEVDPLLEAKVALMREARESNELRGDVAGAISRWREAAAVRVPGDDPRSVIAIMMDTARKRVGIGLEPEHRDVPGALQIYGAVLDLEPSTPQRWRVVQALLGAAAALASRQRPDDDQDVAGARLVWDALQAMDLRGSLADQVQQARAEHEV